MSSRPPIVSLHVVALRRITSACSWRGEPSSRRSRIIWLNITIAAVGYYYLTNRFTGEILFERDYMDPEKLDERLEFNVDTIMRLVTV